MENKIIVSCICPTYNRKLFLENLIYMYNYQTYKEENRELIILDDSEESNEEYINQIINKLKIKYINNIRYIYSKDRLKLGQKRNMLNKLAEGEYIICMDDDDYYPPEKITYTINRMRGSKSQISGSSLIYVYYSDIDKIYTFGPYSNSHATNGTLCYEKSFVKNRLYEQEAMMAEEKHFLDGFSIPILQLEPLKTILCISHNSNTVDKNKFKESGNELPMKLKNVIKDKKLLEFYKNLNKK